MEDFNFKKYIEENKLLKEDKEYSSNVEVTGQYEGPGVWEDIKELIR
jgi:hypothetical protein